MSEEVYFSTLCFNSKCWIVFDEFSLRFLLELRIFPIFGPIACYYVLIVTEFSLKNLGNFLDLSMERNLELISWNLQFSRKDPGQISGVQESSWNF